MESRSCIVEKILSSVWKVSVKSRNIEGLVKTVTLKRDRLGRLWIIFSLVMKVDIPEFTAGKTGGFDFGLSNFLTNDEGLAIQSPEFFKQSRSKIASLNRELSRKKAGSNHRKSVKHRLAKAHDAIANKRRDWFFKLAHDLCDEYTHIFLEDLNLRGMQRRWGRKISDLAFAEFVSILKHAAFWRGVIVHQIDRWNQPLRHALLVGRSISQGVGSMSRILCNVYLRAGCVYASIRSPLAGLP
ncbi:MAG: RNA-guided endonuclease InsQ/TnpB family protein [Chloroflexota bacterium]